MAKPTYKQLERRVRELEKQAEERRNLEEKERLEKLNPSPRRVGCGVMRC